VRRFVERCDRSWDHVLAALLEGEDRASEPAALRTLVASLPDGGALFVGNSQPIRDLNEFCVALPENVGVVTQRGVAGIDGNIASLLGMSAVSRVPVTAVIGDVAFFHDAGALLEQGAATAPTVLLVLNNGGGRIFEALPIAQAPDVSDGTLERLWLTPRSPAITAVAAAYGARGASTASLSELASLLTEAYERDGLTVIEVVADPTLTAQIRTRARDASAAND
jgi:2-succinyl-5-enolpyruvyl-6-hydroxy-3-cyclohexene-1-carboxylate synthase